MAARLRGQLTVVLLARLHAATAHRLRFEHPVTKAEVDVSSELPSDLSAALALARG